MRDRLYQYIKAAGRGLSSDRLLAEVLQLRSPSSAAADKIVFSMIKDDPRFGFSNGLWHPAQTIEIARWETACAALSMESSGQQKHVRGSLWISLETEFEFGPDAGESLAKARLATGDRPLLVWNEKDIQLWRRMLAVNRLPEWNGQSIAVQHLAECLNAGPAATVDALASVLKIHAPADCSPTAIARFLPDCFLLLLERLPAEVKTDVRALRDWIASARTRIDFGRFGFDEAFLRQLAEGPGAYVMRDRSGGVLYVGQSRNLKRRVRSYFVPRALRRAKIQKMHERLYDIEILPTKNEVEALLLEMRLIRKLHPSINLQTEIHARPGKQQRKNLLLFISTDQPGGATIYFLLNGQFTGKHSVRLHHTPSKALRAKIKKIYFVRSSRSAGTRDPGEMEIVTSWISRNERRLNWIDVDEAGTCRNVIERLEDYLHDPDELRKKVFYR